ncbi:MAG: type II secretion system protein [Methylococcales bacterium]|nr:MAG: type II secretion system protein [Methylococcales bacterium]
MIKHSHGFTLIELILVIVLMSILSAYMAAKLNFASYDADGCAETLKASLRLGQKLAVAQRTSGTTVAPRAQVNVVLSNTCGITVGATTYPALHDVSVTPVGTVSFDGLGQPYFGALMTVVKTFAINGGSVSRYVCLEAVTGYVHEESASCG